MSAVKPYERELDSREKLESDVREWAKGRVIGGDFYEKAIGWLDRQAAITERAADWCASCESEQRIGKLQARLDMAQEAIDGLRESLDETIAERNELQAKLDDFDGDCYCGATVTEWYDLAVRLQAELEAKERLERDSAYMRLPVDVDGVPLKPGDEVEPSGVLSEYVELPSKTKVRAVGDGMVVIAHPDHKGEMYGGGFFRHVQPDTVESMLEEYVSRYDLCLRFDYQGDDTPGSLREEYAERIRKAVER